MQVTLMLFHVVLVVFLKIRIFHFDLLTSLVSLSAQCLCALTIGRLTFQTSLFLLKKQHRQHLRYSLTAGNFSKIRNKIKHKILRNFEMNFE